MYPYINIGRFSIGTFGIMLWLAAVCACWVLHRNFRRWKIDADAIGIVAISTVAGVIGAKLWHVFEDPQTLIHSPLAVIFDRAGFAWFGGLVFGIGALVLQGARARIGALRSLDLAAPAAAFGYGVGRIGCFLSGDGCYGTPTTLPWGMRFPNGLEPTFVPVHPTPLYELAAGLVIGTWLWFRGGKARPTGWILGEYLVLSGISRFLVEFIRRNPKIVFGLSNAQLASAGSVLVGIVLIWWAATHRIPEPERSVEPVGKIA